MDFNVMSVLTLIIGFFVGFAIILIVNAIKNNQNEKGIR